MTILDKIVADTRLRLEESQRRQPLDELKRLVQEQPPPLDLAGLIAGGGVKLIAEVKRASPSRGMIRDEFDPVAIAQTYADNGAAAISVLTEPKHFQGNLDHLKQIKEALAGRKITLLRKDFILEPYQVYQSRACGADSLLLIVAILKSEKLDELLGLSQQLGMGCLVEVHNEAELGVALKSSARIIGINNRDLNTFDVDLETTKRLKTLIPEDRIVVSESGIRNRDDMKKLKEWGVNAALIGEALMSAPDIAVKMKELL